MNEKMLRALIEAGVIKQIYVVGSGAMIYVKADLPNESITAQTLQGKLKTWRTVDAAVRWVRGLGVGKAQLDIGSWQPSQKGLKIQYQPKSLRVQLKRYT